MKNTIKYVVMLLMLVSNMAHAQDNKIEQEYLQKLAESFDSNTKLKHEGSNTFWSRCLGSESKFESSVISRELRLVSTDSLKRKFFYQRINYYLSLVTGYYPQLLDVKTMQNVIEEKKNKKGKVVSSKTVEKLVSVFDVDDATRYYAYIASYEQLPEMLDTCMRASTYEKNETHPDSTFKFIEAEPEYPGGGAALIKFLMTEVRFPDYEKEHEIVGKVIVRFVVCPSGRATSHTIVRSAGQMFDAEALRVVKMLPKFNKPGTQQGKPVKVYYNLPINFNFQ